MSITPYERHLTNDNGRWFGANLMTLLATKADTNGLFSVVEAITPKGGEPPPHTHAGEDEAFYIIEGNAAYRAGDLQVEAGPGSFIFLPRGIEHAFMIQSDVMKTLVLLAPGGFEDFFLEMSVPAQKPTIPPIPLPPDIERWVESAGKLGVQFARPPDA